MKSDWKDWIFISSVSKYFVSHPSQCFLCLLTESDSTAQSHKPTALRALSELCKCHSKAFTKIVTERRDVSQVFISRYKNAAIYIKSGTSWALPHCWPKWNDAREQKKNSLFIFVLVLALLVLLKDLMTTGVLPAHPDTKASTAKGRMIGKSREGQ